MVMELHRYAMGELDVLRRAAAPQYHYCLEAMFLHSSGQILQRLHIRLAQVENSHIYSLSVMAFLIRAKFMCCTTVESAHLRDDAAQVLCSMVPFRDPTEKM